MYTPALHYGLNLVMIHLNRHESIALMGSEYLGVPMSVLSVPQLIGVLLFQCQVCSGRQLYLGFPLHLVYGVRISHSFRFLEMMS